MKKNYYFLAGFPRSGNTLLSSILNQNKDIYCSNLSPIPDMLWSYERSVINSEHFKRNPNINLNLVDIGKNIFLNYYANIDKSVIIDREKGWATPGNMLLIKKYINHSPKIIFTVRPIVEILTSFICLLEEESYIDLEMRQSNWWYKDYLSKNDNRCEYLMRPGGQIDVSLLALNEVLKTENSNTFCIVEYEDIVKNSKNTMNQIYNFLEMPKYNHDFNNIKKIEEDFDGKLGFPKNLHTIRPKINKTSKDPNSVLSEYIINKYSNMEWWKK